MDPDPADPTADPPPDPAAALARLAAAHGVATRYLDADGVERIPPPSTVRAVLEAMGVPCGDDQAVRRALASAATARWRRTVPPTAVVRASGGRTVDVVLPAPGPPEAAADVAVLPEGGGDPIPVAVVPADPADGQVQRTVDGTRRVRARALVPDEVGLGAHRLRVRADGEEAVGHLLVVPDRCPLPPGDRSWGWQVQLYALRSRRSWGVGDLADLDLLVREAGTVHGADFVLLNPLHAATPGLPQEPSPYFPASRRAWNPLYLRPERCDGWAAATGADRAALDALQAEGVALAATALIDRDAVAAVKDRALRICAAQPLPPDRRAAFGAFCTAGGQALTSLATAFALAGVQGPEVRTWPAELRHPDAPGVAAAATALADEITHQRWLQWQADEQLAAAQRTAREAGMALGLLTDLAVGVDAQGADGWALADDLARDVTVGAPPDALAQRGQDWRLPPLRPDRLAATGYRAFRELVAVNLRHAGGIRIDHVMGLFRLFWIPEGASATDGTYVRYDAEAMLGALALEAHRAGGVVVGEDLGTVEAGVRETMAERGVLGSAVFWFEQDRAGAPAAAGRYRRLALTSVTTHDLPTVAGWAADEPTRIRAVTGQLATTEAQDRARSAAERDALLDLLVEEGVLDAAAREDPDALRDAVHEFVARTPSLLVSASLADAVGDPRQPNLPGADGRTYPSWCLPIAVPDPDGDDVDGLLPPARALPLEDLLAHPGVARLSRVLSEGRTGGA
jgi:4-alpha-glucanotransferase